MSCGGAAVGTHRYRLPAAADVLRLPAAAAASHAPPAPAPRLQPRSKVMVLPARHKIFSLHRGPELEFESINRGGGRVGG